MYPSSIGIAAPPRKVLRRAGLADTLMARERMIQVFIRSSLSIILIWTALAACCVVDPAPLLWAGQLVSRLFG